MVTIPSLTARRTRPRALARTLALAIWLAAVLLGVPTVAGAHTVTTIPVGTDPIAVAVNAATNRIYVVNQYSDTVTVIDGATNATATVPVGSFPITVAVNARTN